ncbi:MAG: Gfo/Idh/MocA family oxidoreductase [Thermoleophilia bacterium]|nr:Gfo/Idh/MocA family oxidoreductase [Thermoleophilia bacterium]
MARVPVAVVGAGNMGRHHVRNYAELTGADLRAVVDRNVERAEALAARYGARAFASVAELLERAPEVEAVSIATPTITHREVAEALLAAGRHVLVEKPIAATAADGDRLTRRGRERGLVLAVGHVERFNPAVRELKRRVDAGAMGSLLSLVARRVGVMPPQVADADVIVDLAVHDIDIFRYLLGADRPDAVYANAGRAVAEDRFDFADAFLRFDGVACLLQVNWVTPVKIRSLAVTGTAAYAEVEYVTQDLRWFPARPLESVDTFAELEAYSGREPERVELARREPLALELEEFLRAVRGEPAEVVSGEEATRSIEIAAALAEGAERR